MSNAIRRIGLGVVDQALSSLTSVLFLVALARSTPAHTFGQLSLGYAVLVFGLGVQRGSWGTLIATSGARRLNVAAHWRPMIAWPLLIALTGVISSHMIQDQGPYLMLIAAAALIYPQDALRYVAIAERKTEVALASDSVRLTGSAATIAVTFLEGDTHLLISIWLASAASSLIYIAVKLRVFSPSRRAHGTLLPTPDLKLLTPNALLGTTGPLLLAYAIASFLSFEDVAAVRGGSTLIGPVSLLLGAVPLVVLPEMSRRSNNVRRYMARTQSGLLLLIVLIWGSMVSLIPPSVGRSLLGETWTLTEPIWMLVVIEYCAWALAAGPQAELQAYRRWKHLLLSKIFYLMATILAMLFALRTESLQFVMMGLALTAVLNLFIVICLRERRPRNP